MNENDALLFECSHQVTTICESSLYITSDQK